MTITALDAYGYALLCATYLAVLYGLVSMSTVKPWPLRQSATTIAANVLIFIWFVLGVGTVVYWISR